MNQRPPRRGQRITGPGKEIKRRGSGLGTGPVGNQGGYQGRGGAYSSGSTSGGGVRSSGGKGSLLTILIIVAVVLFGGGAGITSLFGGDGGSSLTGDYLSQAMTANVSNGWTAGSNVGRMNTAVDPAARDKYTEIRGDGQDKMTVMVYMCGADLESKGGMASSDLAEMTAAKLGKNVNLLVYTGGSEKWNNNIVSSRKNQIYKIENGRLNPLEKDLGSVSMTDPSTLEFFINYCTQHYPANRNALILWDHGGGSISGYGYDEKFVRSGSMTLKKLDQALKNSNTEFDFIGFDACLMATAETALTLTPYADYLIASEEVEPGIGWYYTNWLSALSADPSTPTLQIGKAIADDFVTACGRECAGQKTTLSVTDLAELERTVPDSLTEFASSTLDLLQNDEYQTVSGARGKSREFGSSSKVDHVDLVSFSYELGTAQAKELAADILSAVKYNRTSSDMTNAYGLSIYFPYRKMSGVNSAVSAYESIGMDDEYTECIQRFAGMEVGGQAVSGGASSPLSSLFGIGSGSQIPSGGISDILSGLLSGNLAGVDGLTAANSLFLGKGLDVSSAAGYLRENRFDPSGLVWEDDGYGQKVMYLPEEQWSLVQELEKNVFVDDGEGYIDLGLDNVFDFTEDGGLIGNGGESWIAIDRQPVAYYYMDTVTDGSRYTITGRVPAMLNGVRVDLILVFDTDRPYGYVAGAQTVYSDDVTTAVGKNVTQLQDGDVIDFLCDYYAYDGTYQGSYYLGERYVVNGEPEISDVLLTSYKVSTAYRFTDIYRQNYWTPTVE